MPGSRSIWVHMPRAYGKRFWLMGGVQTPRHGGYLSILKWKDL
jgi:hypothetical protein